MGFGLDSKNVFGVRDSCKRTEECAGRPPVRFEENQGRRCTNNDLGWRQQSGRQDFTDRHESCSFKLSYWLPNSVAWLSVVGITCFSVWVPGADVKSVLLTQPLSTAAAHFKSCISCTPGIFSQSCEAERDSFIDFLDPSGQFRQNWTGYFDVRTIVQNEKKGAQKTQRGSSPPRIRRTRVTTGSRRLLEDSKTKARDSCSDLLSLRCPSNISQSSSGSMPPTTEITRASTPSTEMAASLTRFCRIVRRLGFANNGHRGRSEDCDLRKNWPFTDRLRSGVDKSKGTLLRWTQTSRYISIPRLRPDEPQSKVVLRHRGQSLWPECCVDALLKAIDNRSMETLGGRRCSAKGRRRDLTRSCLGSSGFSL